MKLAFMVRKGANKTHALSAESRWLDDTDNAEECIEPTGVSQHIMSISAGMEDLCRMLAALHEREGFVWHILADAFITPWLGYEGRTNCSVYRNTDDRLACSILPYRVDKNLKEHLWIGTLAIADEQKHTMEALFLYPPLREQLLNLLCPIIIAGWEFRQKHIEL